MSSGKGGRTPQAPDYQALAQQQGQLNTDASRLGATLNRINQVGPDGSVSFSNEGDRWTQTTNLSPEQQRLRDQSLGTQFDLGGIARSRLGEFGSMGKFSTQGLPDRVSSLQAPNFRGDTSEAGVAQRGVDLSGLAGIPTDVQGERQRAEDAIYSRSTRFLDPQFQQTEEATRTRLMNQGLREGSEAWNTELANLERNKQAAYGDARDRAVTGGGAEASRLLSDALAARGQGASERFGTADFANRASAQGLDSELARLAASNTASGANFDAAARAGDFQNRARTDSLNERLLERGQPLQEFLSLYGGGYQTPQLGGGAGMAQTPQAADVFGAADRQYQAEVDRYNAGAARSGGLMSGLFGLGSSWLAGGGGNPFAMSDERLKENVRPVGTTPIGHGSVGLYDFNYRGDPARTPQRGVMAHEVEQVQPSAVATTPSGFKAVDYSQVLAGALGKARQGRPGMTPPVLRFGR